MSDSASRAHRLRFVPFNVADEALISGPSASADTGPENLQVASRSDVWRAAGDSTARLALSWTKSRQIGCVALLRGNFSATAQWRICAYFDDALVFDSGISAVAPPKKLGELDWGFDPLGARAFGGAPPFGLYWLPRSVACDCLLIDLWDAAKPEFFEAARLVAGEVWIPDYNLSRGFGLTFSDLSKQSRAADGTLRTDAGAKLRKLSIQLGNLSERDRSRLAEVIGRNGLVKDFLVSVSPQAGMRRAADYTLLAKFIRDIAQTQASHLRYAASIDLEEV
ncbi:MAG: hypothetical protein FWD77_04490 [Betaproteobacteria bacterium]|nr:hypothetical protein [Betaproteobacteria bacterium]